MTTYNSSEDYTDEGLEFTYDGDEYYWHGDMEVNESGQTQDWDNAGYGELEVCVVHTDEFMIYDKVEESWNPIKFTKYFKEIVQEELLKKL